MADPGTLHYEIYQKIAADTDITDAQPDGLGFGVYDYWLTVGKPAAAWQPNGRMNRSIVVLDGGENLHPSVSRSDWYTWDSFPSIYLFGPAHSSTKLAVAQARYRIEQLLIPWVAITFLGERVTFKPDSVIPLDDSEHFPGNVVSIVRWRATGARRTAA